MSDDLPIKISLDPAQAVSGAKKVTDEVAKTEDQAAKTRAAFDALGKSFGSVAEGMRRQTAAALTNTAKGFDSLTEAIRREQAVLERIHGPAKRYAEDLRTIDSMLARGKLSTKEYADEVARLNKQIEASDSAKSSNGKLSSIDSGVKSLNFKQVASGASQAFSLLNEKLQITDTEFGKVAESAVKFGALGAQVAGPWGAAAGAIVGVMVDVASSASNAEAALTVAAHKAAFMNLGTKDLGTGFKEMGDQAAYAGHNVFSLADHFAIFTANVRALHDHLSVMAGVREAFADFLSKSFGGVGKDGLLAQATKQIADYNLVLKLSGASGQKDFHDQHDAINRVLKDFPDLAGLADRAIANLNKGHEGAAKSVKAHTEAVKDLGLVLGFGKDDPRNAAMLAGVDAISGGGHLTDALATQGFRDMGEFGSIKPTDITDTLKEAVSLAADLEKAFADAFKEVEERAEATKKAIGSMGDIMEDQLVNSARDLSSVLVDAANGADVSWSSFFSSMLEQMQKAIVQAAILRGLTGSFTGSRDPTTGSYGGLLGMLGGFASGGTIFPSGSGTADTQTMMFRKAPSETVHINTPAQEAAYRRGGGGQGGGVANIYVGSGDQTKSVTEHNVEGMVLRVIERHNAALRGRLTGR